MRYLILGTTEALRPDGTPLPLGGARLRALLAALALRGGRTASTTELADDVYGDAPPQDAPAALQALVGRLRRVLGADAVVSTPGPGYRLVAGPDDIDLYVFERQARDAGARLDAGDPDTAATLLREALALFRGPALADLPAPAGVRPEAQRLAALRRRVEADLRRGATDGLVPELTELTTTYPYDEAFHAHLIRALRAEGRHADALAAYESARRTLADALGVDPGPELTALHHELLAATPQSAPEPRPGPQLQLQPRTRPDAEHHPVHPADVPTPDVPTPDVPTPDAPTPDAPTPGNIRPRLTSFVGREPEIAALQGDLARSRLVTLTGPGGSGKTRLAEVAALRAVGPAAWIAELAPLDDPEALPGAVLSALRLREINLISRDGLPLQDDPTAHLVEHLARRPLLLVLDNCEHVIGAAAALAETLLTHCPRLRILATSREPLGVPGESVRPVEPLPPHPAHRLFAERARAVRPSFDPAADAATVDEICRRLDGLPLAIELAAARLRLLTPRQIADRLDDRFRLLTSGSRTVLPRQQTLRAVVDWSWDLLEPAERTLLRQVSVFAGGWDLAAAEALAPGAADTLGALVDKSLVVAAPTDEGEMRYRLLETIHEYAAERAAETPALLAATGAAHTAHFTALAEEAEPKLRSGEQLPWIDRIERDLDNIRAALHRALLTIPDEAAAHRLVFAMGWFWWLRNYRPEGLAWVDRATALGEDPDDPADPRYWPRMHLRMLHFFLAVESHTAAHYRDDPDALALVGRVRAAFGAEPGPEGARFPGMLWPFTAYLTEEPARIRALLDSSVANCRRHGGDWEVGVSLMFRTHLVVDMPGGMSGGISGIDEDLAELRVLSRRVGDRWMGAQIASAAAEANMMRGRHEEAGEAYEEALGLAREVGAHAETPFLIARLAELAYRAGDMEAAAKGLEEASREAERYHVRDTEMFVCFLGAAVALHLGDVEAARARLESAGSLVDTGPAPPHFAAVLAGLGARVEAYEGGGAAATASAAAALRAARDAQCADLIVAALGEGLAVTLAEADEPALAVTVLAAVDSWRHELPRSVPELREAEDVTARALAALGAPGLAAARAAGTGLGPDDVLVLAAAYTGTAAPEGPGRVRSS
ncbi:BTAD domain-containing putative transcriptional regulator [Streptomyces sp. SBC-4]|nr:BTAD domain-containing putative transcriptional regulator [Streptomyces sp. SBC-4]MDV5147234.1 BTAD domain-containing putative transcriptional regulator [Streptomyces sp. SBC-4]